MKKCPTCEKTFDNDVKFCHADGTPLVSETLDPYQTIVAGKIENSEVLVSPIDGDDVSDQVSTESEAEESVRKDIESGFPASPYDLDGDGKLDETLGGVLESESYLSDENDFLKTRPFDESDFDTNIPDEFDEAFGQQENSQLTPSYNAQTASVNSDATSQGLAIASLVVGVLGVTLCWFIGFLMGPIAVIMGIIAKRKADSNPEQFGGRGLAIGGIIAGLISFAFSILWIVMIFISILVG